MRKAIGAVQGGEVKPDGTAALPTPATLAFARREKPPLFSSLLMSWIGIAIVLLKFVTVIVCVLLTFTVVLQRPKSEGLGAALGGDSANSAFGPQTNHVLAKMTQWLGGIFLGLCLLIAWLGTIAR
jgi:protein translocase SecG subunit